MRVVTPHHPREKGEVTAVLTVAALGVMVAGLLFGATITNTLRKAANTSSAANPTPIARLLPTGVKFRSTPYQCAAGFKVIVDPVIDKLVIKNLQGTGEYTLGTITNPNHIKGSTTGRNTPVGYRMWSPRECFTKGPSSAECNAFGDNLKIDWNQNTLITPNGISKPAIHLKVRTGGLLGDDPNFDVDPEVDFYYTSEEGVPAWVFDGTPKQIVFEYYVTEGTASRRKKIYYTQSETGQSCPGTPVTGTPTVTPTITGTLTPTPTNTGTITPTGTACKYGVNTFEIVGEICQENPVRKYTNARYVCYDGKEGRLGNASSCLSSVDWKKLADVACAGRANHPYCLPTPTVTTTGTPTITPTGVTPTNVTPTNVTPTQVGACPLKNKAYVRICTNSDCSTSVATNEFDGPFPDKFQAYYGTSNDEQRQSVVVGSNPQVKFGNKPWPFRLFGHPKDSAIGLDSGDEQGAIYWMTNNFNPGPSSFYQRGDRGNKVNVFGYFNGDKYTIDHIECKKNGGDHLPCPGSTVLTSLKPGQPNFTKTDGVSGNPDPAASNWVVGQISDLLIDCKVDYEYGWYLMPKDIQPQACYFRPRTFVKYQETTNDTPELIKDFSDPKLSTDGSLWGVINDKLATEKAPSGETPDPLFWSRFNDPKLGPEMGKYDPCGTSGDIRGCEIKGSSCCGGKTEVYTMNKDNACVTLFHDSKFKVSQKCSPNVKSGSLKDLENINFTGDDYTCTTVSSAISSPNPANPDPSHPDVICGLPVACSEKGVRYEYGWVLTKSDQPTPTATPCNAENPDKKCETPTPTKKPTPKDDTRTFQLDIEGINMPAGITNPCFAVANTKEGLINQAPKSDPFPCTRQEAEFDGKVVKSITVAFKNVTSKALNVVAQINSCSNSEITVTNGRVVCDKFVHKQNPRALDPNQTLECVWANPKDTDQYTCTVKNGSNKASTNTNTKNSPNVVSNTGKNTSVVTQGRAGATVLRLQEADCVEDRTINSLDIAIVLAEWNQYLTGDLARTTRCDTNNDGKVNSTDFTETLDLLGNRY